uniref:Uncharacterized protein n=1 Tax=Salarias fasciatus TaxID=181472 RepID=A0A672FVP5_SALFA
RKAFLFYVFSVLILSQVLLGGEAQTHESRGKCRRGSVKNKKKYFFNSFGAFLKVLNKHINVQKSQT